MRMDVNDDDAAIVRSIIDLAAALGLRTVAEGVETRTAWDQLAVFGCDAAQGWYLSKALSADDATEWLRGAASSVGPHVRAPRGLHSVPDVDAPVATTVSDAAAAGDTLTATDVAVAGAADLDDGDEQTLLA
jgi:predicted signal transduction protein with EAL and GGDEF domain